MTPLWYYYLGGAGILAGILATAIKAYSYLRSLEEKVNDIKRELSGIQSVMERELREVKEGLEEVKSKSDLLLKAIDRHQMLLEAFYEALTEE